MGETHSRFSFLVADETRRAIALRVNTRVHVDGLPLPHVFFLFRHGAAYQLTSKFLCSPVHLFSVCVISFLSFLVYHFVPRDQNFRDSARSFCLFEVGRVFRQCIISELSREQHLTPGGPFRRKRRDATAPRRAFLLALRLPPPRARPQRHPTAAPNLLGPAAAVVEGAAAESLRLWPAAA